MFCHRNELPRNVTNLHYDVNTHALTWSGSEYCQYKVEEYNEESGTPGTMWLGIHNGNRRYYNLQMPTGKYRVTAFNHIGSSHPIIYDFSQHSKSGSHFDIKHSCVIFSFH